MGEKAGYHVDDGFMRIVEIQVAHRIAVTPAQDVQSLAADHKGTLAAGAGKLKRQADISQMRIVGHIGLAEKESGTESYS